MNITELQKELDRCAKCGQCRSVCPVFLALKDETLVARGRMAIIQARSVALSLRGSPTGTTEAISNQTGLPRSSDVTSDSLAPMLTSGAPRIPSGHRDAMTQEADSSLYTKILHTCLMCRRCEENCPSLVETGAVFKSERRRIADEKGLPLLLRLGFIWVLPNRWIYNSVMRLTSLVSRLFSRSRAPVRHLPLYFANLFQRMPRLAPRSALEIYTRSTLHALRSTPVTIFLGCAANYIYPEIIEALTSILDQLKIPYVIPQEQVCCGMPALLSGDEQSADKLGRINQEIFKTETVITVCPTCNRMLAEEYELKGVRVMDAFEFLNEVSNFQLLTSNIQTRTAYHQPCHSAGTKAPEIIKAFLKASTDYQEIDDVCCGGGGLFTFKYPELSDMIGQRRMETLLLPETSNMKPVTFYVVTNCPGCMMQLEYLLSSGKQGIRVRHILNLITDAHKTGCPVPHTQE
ncbi:MAG: (Fe-S)-binding protein [Planctomycetota bacterium]